MNVQNTYYGLCSSLFFQLHINLMYFSLTKPVNISLVYLLMVVKGCFNMHLSTIVRKDKNCAFFDGAISKQSASVQCIHTN